MVSCMVSLWGAAVRGQPTIDNAEQSRRRHTPIHVASQTFVVALVLHLHIGHLQPLREDQVLVSGLQDCTLKQPGGVPRGVAANDASEHAHASPEHAHRGGWNNETRQACEGGAAAHTPVVH